MDAKRSFLYFLEAEHANAEKYADIAVRAPDGPMRFWGPDRSGDPKFMGVPLGELGRGELPWVRGWGAGWRWGGLKALRAYQLGVDFFWGIPP